MSALEACSCFIDTNSAFRNGTSTAGAYTALPAVANTLVGVSSVAAGVFGIPIGLKVAIDGYQKMKTAVQNRDLEGVVQNGLWCGVGGGYAGLSGLLGVNGVYSLQGAAAPAIIGPAFGYGGVGMYGALLGYGAYGLWQAKKFDSEFQSRREEAGDQGALDWLNAQVSLNDEELEGEDQESLLRKKWEKFERRTSKDCVQLVREKLPGLLEHFNPVEARELLEAVDMACFKKRVQYIIFIVLALLGIAASLCVVLTTGPVSPLLFAIGAVTWLTVDSSRLHNYLGDKFWIWFGGKSPPKPG